MRNFVLSFYNCIIFFQDFDIFFIVGIGSRNSPIDTTAEFIIINCIIPIDVNIIGVNIEQFLRFNNACVKFFGGRFFCGCCFSGCSIGGCFIVRFLSHDAKQHTSNKVATIKDKYFFIGIPFFIANYFCGNKSFFALLNSLIVLSTISVVCLAKNVPPSGDFLSAKTRSAAKSVFLDYFL